MPVSPILRRVLAYLFKMFLLFGEFHLHILVTARQAFDAYILTAGFEYILNSDHIKCRYANFNLARVLFSELRDTPKQSDL